jgi:hypothetical protein
MRFGMSMKVKGFILLLMCLIEAERYARELFPEESQDLRHARIYCKEVVSFKEVCDERTNPRTC